MRHRFKLCQQCCGEGEEPPVNSCPCSAGTHPNELPTPIRRHVNVSGLIPYFPTDPIANLNGSHIKGLGDLSSSQISCGFFYNAPLPNPPYQPFFWLPRGVSVRWTRNTLIQYDGGGANPGGPLGDFIENFDITLPEGIKIVVIVGYIWKNIATFPTRAVTVGVWHKVLSLDEIGYIDCTNTTIDLDFNMKYEEVPLVPQAFDLTNGVVSYGP